MKKLLALTSAIILSLSCFVGCGDKDDSKGSGSSGKSASSSSESDLNKAAGKMSTAFDTVFWNLEDKDYSIGNGMIAADGTCFGIIDNKTKASADSDMIIDEAKGYFSTLDGYKWVCVFGGGAVEEVYVADEWDSDVIGTYPETLDTKGRKLDDILKAYQ